jgi:hypothetical protein
MSKRKAELCQRYGWASNFIFFAPDFINPNPTHEAWQLNADEWAEKAQHAFVNAESFDDLPDWLRTALLEAEKRYPEPQPAVIAN